MSSSGTSFHPNENLLNQLLQMGIAKNGAIKALYYTGNSNVDAAMNWLFDGADKNMETTLDEELSLASTHIKCNSTHENEMSGEQDSGDDDDLLNYKMVFVINDALKMTAGKISAQVGHATLGLYRKIHQGSTKFKFGIEELGIWETTNDCIERGINGKYQPTYLSCGIVGGLPHHLVEDAGLTQVVEGSKTVLAIFGEDSEVNKVTGKLKLLS
nr:probable peptidyl-tRNA hydrolase 2 [Lepeophtheirus salmonis]